jgi:hypothetical protein
MGLISFIEFKLSRWCPLPQFIEAWSLTNTQAGWLAGIVSAGYMLTVIPLVGLTDRRPARHIYLASSGQLGFGRLSDRPAGQYPIRCDGRLGSRAKTA